jgi:serine protease
MLIRPIATGAFVFALCAPVSSAPALAHGDHGPEGHVHDCSAPSWPEFAEPTEVSFAESGWADANAAATPNADGLLVDLADGMDEDDIDALADELGLELERAFDVYAGNRIVLRGDAATLARATRLLEGHDDVESVEPNVFMSLNHPGHDHEAFDVGDIARPTKPNDPMYKSQWHFDMVHAEEAWTRANGKGVIVAVLDTGVSPGKLANGKKSKYKRVPDLKGQEFVDGYNFVNNNKDPSDGHGHGTHVAGTIAQATNNGYGVAGLAYGAKIMPIKVLSDRGSGSVAGIAAGIRWAADNGAHVINMSLGGGGYTKSMAKAVEYAHKKGVFIASAAGNGGRQRVEYPAAYPGAFAVSALGPDNKLAFYSSYGKQLFIAAPGGDTRVDLNNDGIPDGVLQDTIAIGNPAKHGFFPFQGTSMATPHVAAAAALVISTGVTDPDRVAEVLKGSAYAMNDPIRYGSGGLNAGAAVKKAQSDSSWLALLLASGLGFALVRRTRRKDSLSTFKVGPGFVGAMVMGASGLFFLHDLGIGHAFALEAVSHPVAEWPAHLLGMGWHLNPLVGSFALAFVPMALGFGFKRLRGALAGFAVGVAGYLFAHAFLGEVNVALIPGHGALDFAWLAANGAIASVLGALAMKRD